MSSRPASPAHRTAAAFLELRSRDAAVARAGSPLPGWRFAGNPTLEGILDEALQSAELRPSPRRAFAALAPVDALPALPATESDRGHHRALWSCGPTSGPEPAPRHRARADLARLGRWLDWYARSAWRAEQFEAAPRLDADVAALWAAWATGDAWSGRARWEALFLRSAVRVFRSVVAARELPAAVADRAVSDLREAFFFRMIGGAPAGWTEVATRVLETAPPDPVSAVHGSLTSPARHAAALCLTCRGSWRTTVARALPGLSEPLARARSLAGDDAWSWDALLDLHCALRLVRSWSRALPDGADHPSADHPRTDFAVLTQNRGRARGRLRAVAAGQTPDTLLENVLALDHLHARTEVALRRFAWAWAWQELAYDFSFDLHRSVTPACPPSATTPEPLSPAARAALPTWVLLVVCRGRLAHLLRWVSTGSTGDRDSAWARLLTDALPPALRDPPTPGSRSATYRRVRTELSLRLPAVLREVRPAVAATAALAGGRTLKARFLGLHAEAWHPSVPLPRSGFPTAHAAAQAALPLLDAALEASDDRRRP